MYLYQPCLLTMALYGWAFDPAERRRRWIMILFPLVVLLVSEWEVTFSSYKLYPASLLLPVCFLMVRSRDVAWAEVLASSLLGGLVCWKAADAWPLLPGSAVLCAVLLLIPVTLLCRDRDDRLLAVTFGSLFFELFFCLHEYMLFSFCALRFGSKDALSLGSMALCIYFVLEQLRLLLLSKKKDAVSIRN